MGIVASSFGREAVSSQAVAARAHVEIPAKSMAAGDRFFFSAIDRHREKKCTVFHFSDAELCVT